MKKAILTCLAVLLSVSALAVPPVLLTNVVVQSVGEERNHEHLPAGLLFLDADDGRLMIADEDNPHGRAVCACKGYPDYHNLTNTLRANGHRIELNGEYSVQAELGILSVRAGTNSLLRILHSPHGELAPLTCSYETNNTLLLVANAPADSILQICTNLMESPRWSTATNAVIAETTDAATTWRITLIDSPVPEFYRVLSSISLDAGIYASLPLHANAGIEMGGEKWDAWPDIGTIATNAADAAVAPVAGDLADHAADTDNPHGVTAAQVGAPTVADLNAVSNAINDHIAAAVDPVEERVGELEEQLEEYWCTWAATKLADGVENWIPTNWPARKVWCCLYINRRGVFTISMPNWSPPEPCELHLLIRKQGGTNSALTVNAPDGTTLASSSAASASSRVCEFYYHPATGWITGAITWSQSLIPTETLPDDTTFLPTTNNPVSPVLSMSPSILPSLSAGRLEDLDSLDTLDEPDKFEPAAEVVE